MPPRAEPGDRKKIEAALGSRLRGALRDLCSTLGVPPSRWQEVPSLERTFSTAAVVRRAAAYEGLSEREALIRAAYNLDLSPDTILTRLHRWS